MRQRPLGRTEAALSVIGLGAWSFGGPRGIDHWGPQDDKVSIATVRAALDAGVSWIDTAPVYGFGHSERVVGQAVRGRRDKAFIATKCGVLFEDAGAIRAGSRRAVRSGCEASLRRLGTGHLDLLQLHFPCDDVPIEETWQHLAELVDEGKVRHLGLCNVDVNLVARCLAVRTVDAVQIPYSLLHREAEQELLPYCLAQGVAVLAFGALSQGFLTSDFDLSRTAAEDFRRKPWMTSKVPAAQRLTADLQILARERHAAVSDLAIAWVADHPSITSVLVGARTARQARANAQSVVQQGQGVRDAMQRLERAQDAHRARA